jgi:hypothetical protein
VGTGLFYHLHGNQIRQLHNLNDDNIHTAWEPNENGISNEAFFVSVVLDYENNVVEC